MLGVTIGANSIIGANSVVTKTIPKNSVAVGNPAKVICSYEDYIEKQKKMLEISNKFDNNYVSGESINRNNNEEMFELLKNNTGFIR